MLVLYASIIFFGLGMWLMIKSNELSIKYACLWIFSSVCFALLLTGFSSAITANFDGLLQSNSVETYGLYDVAGDYVVENSFGDYIVIYEDDNLNVLTCNEDNTVFVNEGDVASVAIYSNDYKSPILRHLLFNWTSDDYVISCDFDTVKPYIKTP